RKTWFDLKKNQPINYLDLNGNYNFWYYNNGNIEAIGNLNNNGQQNDKWLFFDQSGRVSAMGNYTNGKKSGNWTYFKLGKKTENITYSNGLVQDTAFTYYANGNINKTILFNNDLRNGYYQENYMNNQPYIIGNYKDGYYHGNFTYY